MVHNPGGDEPAGARWVVPRYEVLSHLSQKIVGTSNRIIPDTPVIPSLKIGVKGTPVHTSLEGL